MSIDTRQGHRHRRQRTAAQRGPHEATRETTIRAGIVESATRDELVIERVTPDVLRVTLDGRVLGFVEHVGRVHVALAGDRYDRAVEVAQALDVDAAARALA